MLPPTTSALLDDSARPYFLWWTTCTVAQLRDHLRDPAVDVQAYWLGAVLREANTRDVWLFTTVDEIRSLWPRLWRHLGHSGERWAFLLDLPAPPPMTTAE